MRMLPNRIGPIGFALWLSMAAAHAQAQALQDAPDPPETWTASKICQALKQAAVARDLPVATFARLIWTESRFDANALSPKGAQGIAQFMPATASERGLANPYDPGQAIPASAALLAELREEFGNFGLAAAAYNAGPGRVRRWLAGRSQLPFETQDYVAAITGKTAARFRVPGERVIDFSLRKGESFEKSCANLPIRKTRFRGARVDEGAWQPWGVQVAGNFSRDRAMRSWLRMRSRLGVVVGDARPRLHRQPAPRGMRGRWAVRLGTGSRAGAVQLCQRIRAVGGACIVRKNRS